ncbi:MAG TPA: putative monovalent cation/H+ antiporter subunit A [Moheibacter sp.]|nr:putative monovalent cation/H+ antiporter subunit A [Moheibacter sp.]
MIGILITVFVVAFLILFSGNLARPKYFKFITALPLLLFFYFGYYLVNLQWEPSLLLKYDWIPSLGINLDFKLDGLSILFSLLITGIGSLIYFYASDYLKNAHYLNRFYCYLTLFMGAMLGLVLSDNLITIFIFWELTSITSFFLIGFNNEEENSRKSAMTAFAITGLGGFFLLSGFLLIANISGTYSITELMGSRELLQNNPLYLLILIFIFGGAFTKSAQFPFHFWLPGAMAAPTPVSAYLHSATMVKAGIYLLARFAPVLSDGYIWNYTLMIVGGITMIYGAFHSIFRTDLKSILAYSTISALGIIVFLLGIGTEYAIYAAVTFILVHALYKATLFLVAGIIDHAVHTRDITQLWGLGKYMPVVATAAIIAALSSAGVPLTFGFLSKDLIYESTLNISQWGIWLTVLVISTNVLLACAGFLAGVKPFLGKSSYKKNEFHRPSFLLWLPVVILSCLTLIYGIFPFLVDNGILKYAFQSIAVNEPNIYLKIWHGFNTVLLLSVLTIFLGAVLFVFNRYLRRPLQNIYKLEAISPQHLTESFGEFTRKFAFIYTRLMHNGYLRNYLIVIIVFITVLVGYRLFTTLPIQVITEDLSGFRIYELTVFIIIVISTLYTIKTTSRLTAITSLGVIGYCLCLIFVFYGAPDLAMTQFAIDTLTVVLFVLVLFKLPGFLPFRNKKIIVRDALVSLGFGGLIMLITLQSLVYPANKEISRFYAENAYVLAKGKNIVNVILVDFRGFDTLIESIVLSIAALGVYGILKYRGINEEAD